MAITHLLTITRFAILSLGAMDESGGFCVKTVQTIGLFIDKGIILRNKLPSDLRGDNRSGIGRIRHAVSERISVQSSIREKERQT